MPDDRSMSNESNRLIYAGLLGLSVATVLQCVQNGATTIALLIAMYSVAVAIPLLAVGLVADYAQRDNRAIPWWVDPVGVLGGLAALVGFGAVFFHLDPGIGYAFSATTVLALLMVRRI